MYFNYFVIISLGTVCTDLNIFSPWILKLTGSWVEIGWVVLEKKYFFQLSLFSNLLLSPVAKWCGLSLPKTFSFFHAVFLRVKLKRTRDSGNQVSLPMTPFKNITHILYRKLLGWSNYSSVAFDDETWLAASVFVQSHLFSFNISIIFF